MSQMCRIFVVTKRKEMVTKQIDAAKQEKLKAAFTYRGAITDAAKKTKLHRTTVVRIVELGRGNVIPVNKLEKYADNI